MNLYGDGGMVICLCIHVTYTPTVLQNWDVSMQLKFIATIHEVNNVRSSQQRTITAYNGFFS